MLCLQTRQFLCLAMAATLVAVPLARAETNALPASTNMPPIQYKARDSRPLVGLSGTDFSDVFDFSGGISGSGSFDSGEAAVVVFVVAGVVIVAAAVVYPGIVIADWLTGGEEPDLWSEAGLRAGFFGGDGRSGSMSGAAITFGIETDGPQVGAVIEGGYLDASVATVPGAEADVSGGYVMAGPVIRWALTDGGQPVRFETELLAGTASSYSFISRASFAFTWGISEHGRIGVRFGALYADLDKDEGPFLEADEGNFTLLGGIETAWQF